MVVLCARASQILKRGAIKGYAIAAQFRKRARLEPFSRLREKVPAGG
jgi:hypothetical protein